MPKMGPGFTMNTKQSASLSWSVALVPDLVLLLPIAAREQHPNKATLRCCVLPRCMACFCAGTRRDRCSSQSAQLHAQPGCSTALAACNTPRPKFVEMSDVLRGQLLARHDCVMFQPFVVLSCGPFRPMPRPPSYTLYGIDTTSCLVLLKGTLTPPSKLVCVSILRVVFHFLRCIFLLALLSTCTSKTQNQYHRIYD